MKSVVFLFLVALCFQKTQSQDTIHWSNHYELRWQDFTGSPQNSSKNSVITNAIISYSLSANQDSMKIRINCFFRKSRSWSNKKSDNSLWFMNEDISLLRKFSHANSASKFSRISLTTALSLRMLIEFLRVIEPLDWNLILSMTVTQIFP